MKQGQEYKCKEDAIGFEFIKLGKVNSKGEWSIAAKSDENDGFGETSGAWSEKMIRDNYDEINE